VSSGEEGRISQIQLGRLLAELSNCTHDWLAGCLAVPSPTTHRHILQRAFAVKSPSVVGADHAGVTSLVVHPALTQGGAPAAAGQAAEGDTVRNTANCKAVRQLRADPSAAAGHC
jgi:hypothetical protein